MFSNYLLGLDDSDEPDEERDGVDEELELLFEREGAE
jgi:hypothetical protein